MTSRKSPLASPARRRFMDVSARYGFTTAVLAATGGYLWSDAAVAQTAADEDSRARNAQHRMILATEYKLGSFVSYPIMQEAFKENAQNLSKGALYVKLFPAGQLGVGGSLAQKVQGGTVNAGGLSLSNFSAYAPAVDLINIPYWCGENQRYANLVTSKAWADEITPKVNAKNYKPLFYYTVDPRTIAVRKGFGRIVRTPDDMKGVKMRDSAVQAAGALLSARRRQPDHRRLGRDADRAKAGCGGCARSGDRRALYVRLHRHPRSDHDGRVGAGRADVRVQPAVVQRPAQRRAA